MDDFQILCRPTAALLLTSACIYSVDSSEKKTFLTPYVMIIAPLQFGGLLQRVVQAEEMAKLTSSFEGCSAEQFSVNLNILST